MDRFDVDLKLMLDEVRLGYTRRGFDAWTKPYTYSSNLETSEPLQPAYNETVIRIDSDSFFVWLAIESAVISQEHGPGNIAQVAFQGHTTRFIQKSTGFRFADNKYRLPGYVFEGSGEAPYILPFPFLFPPSDALSIEHTSLFLDQPRVQTQLIGAKLFTRPWTEEIILPEPG